MIWPFLSICREIMRGVITMIVHQEETTNNVREIWKKSARSRGCSVGENNLALNLPLNPTKLMHDTVTKFVLQKERKKEKGKKKGRKRIGAWDCYLTTFDIIYIYTSFRITSNSPTTGHYNYQSTSFFLSLSLLRDRVMGKKGMEAPLLGNHGLANSQGKSWRSRALRFLLAFLTVTSQFLFLPSSSSGFNLIHFLSSGFSTIPLFVRVSVRKSKESIHLCCPLSLLLVLGFNHNT